MARLRTSVLTGPARVVRILVLSVLSGVLVALVALPLVGGFGLLAKAAADHFDALPANLVTPPLPQRSVMLAADGSVLAVLHGDQDRVLVSFAQIPAVTREALIAIEDSRFYDHRGVDIRGTVRALLHNSAGGGVQGGSTLTQQYVKNVLLEQASTPAQRAAAVGETASRKLQEARYALALEQRLTKDQILERYFNIAYYGNGVYGVGTAAQHYFARSVSDLDLAQSALLAGMVQNANLYDPVTHPQAATDRRNTVLDRMAELGMITRPEADTAKAAPLAIVAGAGTAPALDPCQPSPAPFFCALVRRQLEADPLLGSSPAARDRRLLQGGLTIRTTLQPAVQQAAQAQVDAVISRVNRVAAPVVVMQPGTGAVLALAVNRTYGDAAAANETKEVLATAAVQPGSTFKMFTLVAALEDGFGTGAGIYAPACYQTPVFPGYDTPCPAGGVHNAGDSEAGYFTLDRATWNSVNTYYVQLEERVGVPKIVDVARRMGIPSARLAGIGPTLGSLTIGGRDMSPLDMVTAYATLAAHGLECDPRLVTGITDLAAGGPTAQPAGAAPPAPQNVTFTQPRPCAQVVAPAIADTATSVLQGVITSGTGYPNAAAIGRPAAGKTGTTDNSQAAWFVGFTPQLATAVELSDPRGAPTHPLPGMVAAGRTWGQVFGGDVPAIIWGRVMSAVLSGVPVAGFPPPDPTVVAGATVPVPYTAGSSLADAQARLSAAGFTPMVTPMSEPGTRGYVVRSIPPSGMAPAGSIVNLVPGG